MKQTFILGVLKKKKMLSMNQHRYLVGGIALKTPDKDNNIFESLSAADTQIGFDYQTNYFLLKLLESTEGQTIEYEVKDDVNIIHNDGTIEYIQVKHTVNVGTENLTELDSDLWKTFSNWSKIISTKLNNIDLKKSKFTIFTNKELGPRNKLVDNIIDFQKEKVDFLFIKTYLNTLKTKNIKIDEYMKTFLNLKDFKLKFFLKQVNFITSDTEIIGKIKKQINFQWVDPNRVDDVFNCLFSNLKISMNDLTLNKKIISYTSESFHKRFIKCFEKGRLQPITQRSFECSENEIRKLLLNPERLIFLKQLHDIQDIDLENDEDEDIFNYTSEMLSMLTTLKKLEQNGDLLAVEKEKFQNNAKKQWRSEFKSMKKKINLNFNNDIQEKDIVKFANLLLDEIRKISLKLEGEEYDIDLSNGLFYFLSNNPDIGWRVDWKEKYEIK